MKTRMKKHPSLAIILQVVRRHLLLFLGIFLLILGAIVCSLLPPLVLEKIVDRLAGGYGIPVSLAALYFALLGAASLCISARDGLLTVFGQKIIRSLRHALCDKLSRLPAATLSAQDPGAVSSRFVGDADTVEELFTDGIASMFADCCTMIGIFVVILQKSSGLAILLLFAVPVLFAFTRFVQKRMLRAQIDNRAAIARASAIVPETLHCIRTIHALGKESYLQKHYDQAIQESFSAVNRTNFFDAVYSPIIQILQAVLIGLVMLFAASQNPQLLEFFGMSAGTAVAMAAYISQIFGPIENIGMEIQTIQSAAAGVHRMDEFLLQEERWETDSPSVSDKYSEAFKGPFVIELQDVSFGYEKNQTVLKKQSLSIRPGEQVTLTGRTGAGKSTLFKLLLGLYRPQEGRVLVEGRDASRIADKEKRRLFGYVEQNFRLVPGSVLDQITLFDPLISRKAAMEAASLVGLDSAIEALPQGVDTPCAEGIFSQGQWQLLSIARAIAAGPRILLLDEITANLDADTEQQVLTALRRACAQRTVVSISHRLYEHLGGREITLSS